MIINHQVTTPAPDPSENDPEMLAQIEAEEHAERVAAYDEVNADAIEEAQQAEYQDYLSLAYKEQQEEVQAEVDALEASGELRDGGADYPEHVVSEFYEACWAYQNAYSDVHNCYDDRAVSPEAKQELTEATRRVEAAKAEYDRIVEACGPILIRVHAENLVRHVETDEFAYSMVQSLTEQIPAYLANLNAERQQRDLLALTQDPQWTEATKHLDAVAAFVAQGTHNPRAYARAQSRFVGSILKLTQNHMEDTISKAVEDRFALLSHDGIEDSQVLSNRLELLRDAVNEVFQYPDLNDVVGRDMVGL